MKKNQKGYIMVAKKRTQVKHLLKSQRRLQICELKFYGRNFGLDSHRLSLPFHSAFLAVLSFLVRIWLPILVFTVVSQVEPK